VGPDDGSNMVRLAFGLLPLLAACGQDYKFDKALPVWPPGQAMPIPDTLQEDVILQVTIPVVDVLFVIDNSCSMDDEQGALAASFPGFIGYFVGSGLEWHVGVVSTDLDNSVHQGKLVSAQGALFIDESTPDPHGVFSEMAALGTTGTGDEKGLGATYLALAGTDENGYVQGHRDTYNAGFYRDDAAITTIVISDEPDQTPDNVVSKKEFIEWYNALKLASNERSFSSIVDLDRGSRYLDVTKEIGGTTWDIRDSDWDKVLDYLGLQASGLRTEFFLSQIPVVSTIEVSLELPDGSVLVAPDVPAWTYLGEDGRPDGRNSIKFVEYIPDSLTRVTITYTRLSSAQDPDTVPTLPEE
jgi:hypothetical protein